MPEKVSSESVTRGRFHFPTAAGARNDDGEDRRSAGPLPGIVLVHDVWGLSPHSEALARDLAAEGFAVLEIDLYRELPAVEIDDVGRHIRSLSDHEIVLDLEAGANWLAAQSVCRHRKVGIMGVCMGGTFTLLAACLSDRFAAAAPFYGILSYESGMLADPDGRDRERKPLSPIEAADRLVTPLLGSFGREDGFVPESDVDLLEAGLRQSGSRFEIDRYAGAGHAFLNRTRDEAYRAAAAAAAWKRIIPFFRKELG